MAHINLRISSQPGPATSARMRWSMPHPRSFRKWSFAPVVHPDPPSFPQPLLGRAAVQRKKKAAFSISSDELFAIAEKLKGIAATLEAQVEQPTLEIQIGYMLLDGTLTIPQCIKLWDPKGKGEVMKGSMKNNLRAMGFSVPGGEVDALFDSWDADKGGVLDLKELNECLAGAMKKAQKNKSAPNPSRDKAKEIRKKAEEAEEAANLSDRAMELEGELQKMITDFDKRADLRLGALLQARMVKPAAVVTSWGSSRGEHAGELSKADFRNAVIRLFKGLPPIKTRGEDHKATMMGTPPATERLGTRLSSQSAADESAEQAALATEIDGVFDIFDADHGGYLDAEEALNMIKQLQLTGNKAATERRSKEYEVLTTRARANRMGIHVRQAAAQLDAMQNPMAC